MFTLYLDAQSLIIEVNRGSDRTGPGVQVKEGSSCQSQQGDDGRSRKRGEQKLEEEVHGAGTQTHTQKRLRFSYYISSVHVIQVQQAAEPSSTLLLVSSPRGQSQHNCATIITFSPTLMVKTLQPTHVAIVYL